MSTVTEGILNMPIDLAASDELSARQVIAAQRARIAELEGREITEEQITRAFINWHGSDLRPCPIRSAFEGGYRAALRGDEENGV